METTKLQPFQSILFANADGYVCEASEAPDYSRDLNLDQIIGVITSVAAQDTYLKSLFHVPLSKLDDITYRQAVMRDLENEDRTRAIQSFADQMRTMRDYLERAHKRFFHYERQRWFLDAVDVYCAAVFHLARDLQRLDFSSPGLRAFCEWLDGYCASAAFIQLSTETSGMVARIRAIRYGLLIDGSSVTVKAYGGESDYTAVVTAVFDKFSRGETRDYRIKPANQQSLNHVDARILDRVVKLDPEPFRALDEYCAANVEYQSDVIAQFDRDIQFYLAYRTYMEKFRATGLSFCYPTLSAESKQISSRDGFDLALAAKLIGEHKPVVRNDFFLRGAERVFVVSGPNQGGKTTFARVFGQLHYLASLGCPVPGTQARLFLCDRIFTHFDRQEDIATLRGKLQDDLVRIKHVLDRATPYSIIIMNESFSSTSLADAIYLTRHIMARIAQLDALAVCVTFLTELAASGDNVVSVVGGVDPDDPAVRTYKIERRPADGLAYAFALAQKHRVTYAAIKERIKA